MRCSTRTISIKVLVKFLYRSVLRSYFIYLENCYLQRIIKTNWWIFHVNVSAATRPPSLQIIITIWRWWLWHWRNTGVSDFRSSYNVTDIENNDDRHHSTGIPKGMSLSHMRHIAVLFVLSLKFTYVKMRGPNKLIQPQKNMQFYITQIRHWKQIS